MEDLPSKITDRMSVNSPNRINPLISFSGFLVSLRLLTTLRTPTFSYCTPFLTSRLRRAGFDWIVQRHRTGLERALSTGSEGTRGIRTRPFRWTVDREVVMTTSRTGRSET